MNFISFTFLLYLLVVIFLYYALPKKYIWLMLLLASYFFYAFWNYKLLFLIVFTTLVAYIGGIIIDKTNKKWLKNTSLIFVIVTSLSVLFIFKYLDFFINNIIIICNYFGFHPHIHTLKLLLPIGISFYSFQTLSYVIDVYRENITPEYHFGYFALFVSFFPQLVAGPIERPDHLLPQLKTKNKFELDNLITGLYIALFGFFKKVIIADTLAQYVNIVYNNVNLVNGFEILIATIFFAFQIYCDFSGYTDIAIGVSKMIGIDLIQNFNKPYKARNIKDFWSRWHISLTTWFRDYLYIPLGGNRVSKTRHLLNILIVFLVSGLWHGAEWTFIIWGGLHAIYQIVSILTYKFRNKCKDKIGINQTSNGYLLFSRIVTFTLVCFAWLFFRANSISDCIILLRSLFTNWQINYSYFIESFKYMNINSLVIINIVLSLVLLGKIDTISVRNDYLNDVEIKNEATQQMRINTAVYIIFIVIIVGVSLAISGADSSFIYFQF